MKKMEKYMGSHSKTGEQKALEMLVQLFDWLDDCKPQPTTEIVYLYEISQDIEAAITDTLALIDQGSAKNGKENTTAASKKVVSDLERDINSAINTLAQLVERYARLSLSGSFAAQVSSTVRLPEQALEGKRVGPDQLQKVNKSLEDMKRKLELLNNARGNYQESEAR